MIRMTAQRIAAEVRAIIARSGKKHGDVAEALGLSPSQLSRRVKGDIPFSAEQIAKLAQFFDVPVSAFFPEEQAA